MYFFRKNLTIYLLSNEINNKNIVKMKEWKSPKIIVGNKATGEYYYERTELQNEIILEINKGNHILIADPRRFGKTSIMHFIVENCPNNMKCIFENIQGINSKEEFYKKFYELILNSLSKDKQIWNKVKGFFSEINIKEVTIKGVSFDSKKEIDYLKEIDAIKIYKC